MVLRTSAWHCEEEEPRTGLEGLSAATISNCKGKINSEAPAKCYIIQKGALRDMCIGEPQQRDNGRSTTV